ncbi:hypothetical protein Btru_016396 [Bulinus truncatus]|nr:hypothetical protein Btru_016396 [Bulinus truncatus]
MFSLTLALLIGLVSCQSSDSIAPTSTSVTTHPSDSISTLNTTSAPDTNTTIAPSNSTNGTAPVLSPSTSSTSALASDVTASNTATPPLPSSSTPAVDTTTTTTSSSSVQPTTMIIMPSTSVYDDTNATTTSLPTTTPTTTTLATTTTPTPSYQQHDLDNAVFIFKLTLSNDRNKTADIYYTNSSWTQDDLQVKLKSITVGNIWISELRTENGQFVLLNKFFYSNQSKLDIEFNSSLAKLDEDKEFEVTESAYNATYEFFRSSYTDVCKAINVCPLGFECQPIGCVYSCSAQTCNNHGQCNIQVNFDKTVAVTCICDESYDTEFYGDRCENSRTGKLQIIAIIAGVLGAVILVLFIALIVVCCSGRRKGSEYNFVRKYDNGAFETAEK